MKMKFSYNIPVGLERISDLSVAHEKISYFNISSSSYLTTV